MCVYDTVISRWFEHEVSGIYSLNRTISSSGSVFGQKRISSSGRSNEQKNVAAVFFPWLDFIFSLTCVL